MQEIGRKLFLLCLMSLLNLAKQAKAAAEQKKWEEALTHAKAALSVAGISPSADIGAPSTTSPPNAAAVQALLIAGLASVELGKEDEAVGYYTRAATLAPTSVLPWQGLAKLHRKQKQYEALINDYHQLLGIQSDVKKKRDLLARIAEVYSLAGQRQKAIQTWKELLEGATNRKDRFELWKRIISLLEEEAQILGGTETAIENEVCIL